MCVLERANFEAFAWVEGKVTTEVINVNGIRSIAKFGKVTLSVSIKGNLV